MRLGMLGIALVAAAALPCAARAQTERLAGRLDDRTRAAVAAIVDSARAQSLPAEPLVNRALEGASKGADGERIIAAVRSLAGRLGQAREALGRSASDAELVAGAAALRAGATPAFLARLKRDAPRTSLVVPLAVMADLVARGVPADTAATSVLALARSGAREADLVAFRQSVERDIALGAPAGAAASVRIGDAGGATTLATPTSPGTPTGTTTQPPRKP